MSSAVGGDAGSKALDEFAKGIDSFDAGELQTLAHVIDANRLTLPAYEMLGGLDGSACHRLRDYLEPTVLRLEDLKAHRDNLLRRLVFLLEDNEVEYMVYKTLNRSGWVGVDIDVLIEPVRFDDCIKTLLGKGFYAVDDLSKRYAAGLMIKGNPIVVDLHTQITVLGMAYLSATPLFEGKRRTDYISTGEDGCFSLNLSNGSSEAVVRIAHSVIKEGSILVGDFVDVILALSDCLEVRNSLREQHLQFAALVFSYVAFKLAGFDQFTPLLVLDGSTDLSVVGNLLYDSCRSKTPPYRIPLSLRVIALVDHLSKSRELIQIPLSVRNLSYRRSASHLGHQMIAYVRESSP